MTITHELGPLAEKLLTRLLDLADGNKQQVKIDELTAQVNTLTETLHASRVELQTAVDAPQ